MQVSKPSVASARWPSGSRASERALKTPGESASIHAISRANFPSCELSSLHVLMISKVMLFAFANPKGGVGKSTLSVHLTVWLKEQGAKVALVDADVQGSSSVWLKEAAPEIPLVRLVTPDEILEELPKLQSIYEHLVVDGPAGLSELTRAILLLTDVALLPCGPSVLDLRAAFEAIKVLRQVQSIRKGPPKSILIPNGLKTRQRLSKDFVDAAHTLDIPASSGLRDLQAYADSVGQGTVVWRMGPRAADAAAEIKQLFVEVVNDVISDKTTDERRVENA